MTGQRMSDPNTKPSPTAIARAVGMSALVVAAWEYSRAEAKTSTTASSHGWFLRRSPEKLMISFSWALTNVVPIHATPSTQMLALIPDLNTDADRMSFVGTLHRKTIAAPVDSMNAMIAWSRVITG